MDLYQKKEEKRKLEQQLLYKEAKRTECGRKLEYTEQILQANRRAMANIECFQQDKVRVMRRFQRLPLNQRSVGSMQYILENRVSGQSLQNLYGNVEEKERGLAGMVDSVEEQINQLQQEMNQIEERIKELEREICLQMEE